MYHWLLHLLGINIANKSNETIISQGYNNRGGSNPTAGFVC